MNYIEKYDSTKQYYFQDGTIASHEVIANSHPNIDTLPYAVFTDWQHRIIISMQLLDLLRSNYGIGEDYTEAEAIDELNRVTNIDNETDSNALERIASALEFQTILQLPDEEVE